MTNWPIVLWDDESEHTQDILDELENDLEANHHPAVLHALHEVLASHNDMRTIQDPVDKLEALLVEENQS